MHQWDLPASQHFQLSNVILNQLSTTFSSICIWFPSAADGPNTIVFQYEHKTIFICFSEYLGGEEM